MATPNYSPGGQTIVPPAVPLSTYKGPIDMSINDTQRGNDLVNANKEQAASLGVNIPGATEPSVISSTGATDQIKKAQEKMVQMSDKGTKIDPTSGMALHADGSAVAAPQGSTYDEKSGHYVATDGTKYGVENFYGDENTPPSPEYAAIDKLFEPLKANLDANTLSQVNAIQQQYETLKAKQVQLNQNASQSRSRSSLLGGSTQYEPLGSIGISLATAGDGLNRIADLDAKENAAIAAAQNAQATGDMKLMTDKMAMAEKIRTQKQTEAEGVMTTIQKANTDLDTRTQQLRKDEAVAEQMANGATDPAEILKTLSAAGMVVTAADVAASIKNLTPASTAADQYKFSQANVGKLLASGMTTAQIKAVQDHYNGKGDAPELTEAQTAEVQRVLSGITPKAAKAPVVAKPILDGGLTYTPEDHAQDEQKLDASRGEDGFVDPAIYHNLYTAWIAHHGTVEGFIKTFPPKNYINPANDSLPTYLRPKAPAAGGAGVSAADIEKAISAAHK